MCIRDRANPIGLKVGAAMKPEELKQVLALLDPHRQSGRLTLITRFGAGRAEAVLPALIEAARAEGHPVLWSSDPMHGNGTQTPSGLKTRAFGDILLELQEVAEIHRRLGSRLGAVHFELTGEPVTECTGGVEGLAEADLQRAYKSGCDPRLNRSQSLEMAFLLARIIRES